MAELMVSVASLMLEADHGGKTNLNAKEAAANPFLCAEMEPSDLTKWSLEIKVMSCLLKETK